MKLKGWKKLGKKMLDIGFEIDPDIQVFLSAEDACYPEDKVVFFSVLRTSWKDEVFGQNLRKMFPDAPKIPTYIYAFLHEIGHIFTKDTLDNEDKEKRQTVRESGDNALYCALDSEVEATKWAVDYATKNWIFVGWLTVEIERALQKFTDANLTE